MEKTHGPGEKALSRVLLRAVAENLRGASPSPGVSLTTASAHALQAPAPGRAAGSEAGCKPGGSNPSGLGGGSAGWAFKGTSSARAHSATGPADGEGGGPGSRDRGRGEAGLCNTAPRPAPR